MQITVHLGEPFCNAAGSRRFALELQESASVADALALLDQRHLELGRLIRGEELEHPERLGPIWQKMPAPLPTTVLVNRRLVPQDGWDGRALQDGDHLYIIVPTVGG